MGVRVGLAGLEPGTHFTSYLQAARESPAVELVGIAVRPDLVPALRPQLDPFAVPLYDHPAALLDGAPLDLLALSAVPSEQDDLLLEGLRRGLHVVADKPLVTRPETLAAVRRELAAQPRLRVSMLMTLRGDPQRQAVRRLVADGALGRPAMVHSRRAYAQRRESRAPWFFDEARSGGPWADGAIHGIDEALWLTGRKALEAVAYDANLTWPEQPRFFDHGQALLRLEDEGTAIVEHHRLALNDSFLSVLGTSAKVEIDRRNRAVLVDASGERPLEAVVDLPPARNVFADFVESVAGGRPALMDTADTLATMEAVFAVRQAARSGARVRVG